MDDVKCTCNEKPGGKHFIGCPVVMATMFRFVDLRPTGGEGQFTYWDIILGAPLDIDCEQCWVTFADFEKQALASWGPSGGHETIERCRFITPSWAFEEPPGGRSKLYYGVREKLIMDGMSEDEADAEVHRQCQETA